MGGGLAPLSLAALSGAANRVGRVRLRRRPRCLGAARGRLVLRDRRRQLCPHGLGSLGSRGGDGSSVGRRCRSGCLSQLVRLGTRLRRLVLRRLERRLKPSLGGVQPLEQRLELRLALVRVGRPLAQLLRLAAHPLRLRQAPAELLLAPPQRLRSLRPAAAAALAAVGPPAKLRQLGLGTGKLFLCPLQLLMQRLVGLELLERRSPKRTDRGCQVGSQPARRLLRLLQPRTVVRGRRLRAAGVAEGRIHLALHLCELLLGRLEGAREEVHHWQEPE